MTSPSKEVRLYRVLYTTKGVLGRLFYKNFECWTVERPWLDNEPFVSCIPEGRYELGLRRSGVVERSTRGQYLEGWEVCGVPGRTFIMLHPANRPGELEGCIAPGLKASWPRGGMGEPAVFDSQMAFRRLMTVFGDLPREIVIAKAGQGL